MLDQSAFVPRAALVLCAVGGVGVVSSASFGAVSPDVVFGIEDDDQNGTPDEFSSAGLSPAVTDRFSERRTFSEFSLSIATGPVVDSAVISGVVSEQFSFGFGASPAGLVFEVYAANGAADLSDWDTVGVEIGRVEGLVEDFDEALFSFDAAAALQGVLDGGATHVGLRVRTLTAGIGQVNVEGVTLDASFVPAPGGVGLAAVCGFAAVRRRR